jgi:anaerobic selenocysteine-containing dehydrogenase
MEKIKTNCPRDCYDGCGIVVERRADGRLRVLGDPEHPVARGRLCGKCAIAYNGVWQDPRARLLTPLRRTGARGSGAFESVSWETALGEVAQRMRAVIDQDGPAAILHTHYSGTLALIAYTFPNRLFNFLGASEVDPDTICNAAGHVAWTLQFGTSIQGFDPRTARESRCILVWGANPAHSAPHAHRYWLPDSPAQVVVVDPIRTETAAAADLHLQPRPGTDAALAFSLLHCLRRAGRFDAEFIADHTLGYAEIEADIARATPAWGAAQTGVAADQIEAAAAIYGSGPALLWCGQALQRQVTGGNIMRAVGLLPALTGNIGKPGAGFYYLNLTPAFAGIDLDSLVGTPIAKPPGRKVSHIELARRLEDPDEFKLLFAWNTNPLASAPEQLRLRRALAREDLFVIACDAFMTDTARHANIILPASGFLESDDITFSYFHLLIGAQAKVMDPLGESLPNAEIFRRLARALGLSEPALFESDAELIGSMLRQMDLGIDFDALKARGHVALADASAVWHAERKFATPSGRIEIASAQAQAQGLPRTPQAWADALPAPGELRLLTPASKWRMNDSYANDPDIAARSGPASIRLNPRDAAARRIGTGMTVRVSNSAGSIELEARIDDSVIEGVAVTHKGRWPSLESSAANVNVLHVARAADMGDSTSVHSTLVTVAPIASI